MIFIFSGVCTENKWKKVFSHDATVGLFIDEADVKLKNQYNSNAPLHSFLDNLEMLKVASDPYHLRLCYPELTQHTFPCNEWSQTKNPLKITNVGGIGYTPLSVTFNTDGSSIAFRGLAKNRNGKNSNTVIDTKPESAYWWFAIGALQYYNGDGNIPGPKVSVSKVEMYMKRSSPPPIPSGRRKRSLAETWASSVEYISSHERFKRQGSDDSAVETEEEIAVRSYGSRLRYECGPARQFFDEFTQELYTDRWMECNWNQTWTRTDVLDTCNWIQCLNPPEVGLTPFHATTFFSRRRETRFSLSGTGFQSISTLA